MELYSRFKEDPNPSLVNARDLAGTLSEDSTCALCLLTAISTGTNLEARLPCSLLDHAEATRAASFLQGTRKVSAGCRTRDRSCCFAAASGTKPQLFCWEGEREFSRRGREDASCFSLVHLITEQQIQRSAEADIYTESSQPSDSAARTHRHSMFHQCV